MKDARWQLDGKTTENVLKALYSIKRYPNNLDFVLAMTRYIAVSWWNGFSKEYQRKFMPIINPTSKQLCEIIETLNLVDAETPINSVFDIVDSTFLQEKDNVNK